MIAQLSDQLPELAQGGTVLLVLALCGRFLFAVYDRAISQSPGGEAYQSLQDELLRERTYTNLLRRQLLELGATPVDLPAINRPPPDS